VATASDTPTLPQLSVSLDAETIDALALAVARRVAELLPAPSEDGWLDSPAAARYLGISTTSLHKLTSARVPGLAFSQATPNGKCFFRRRDLDAYREQSVKGTPLTTF
jgi:hypothetical protein